MYQPKNVSGRPATLEGCKAQVGKGWHPLVEECYNICVENEIDIIQVKEKFGSLRFYISHGTAKTYNKIEQICARSLLICEDCGEKGYHRDVHGWLLTLCDNCYEQKCKATT